MNGVTTEYLTSGGEVVAQKTGSNVITYTRGADGSLISMNRNGTIYYYQTNLQGDVEQILDGSGTAVVSYTYDAFGRITSMTGDQTLGQENPFRYRSYFFDQESGFYYLQSRYYDPMMGSFISADDRLVENGNMFSYCSNNPVMNVDKDGHSWRSFIFKRVVGTINAITAAMKIGQTITSLAMFIPASIMKNAEMKSIKKARDSMGDPIDNKDAFLVQLKFNKITIANMDPFMRIPTFINNVKNDGKWDYKNGFGPITPYSFNGSIEMGQDLGNIHYGFIGTSLGFSENTLLMAAGAYQVYTDIFIHNKAPSIKQLIISNGDDLLDQQAISRGVELYHETY